jgi:aldehyde dehydrogenase (NAD+)
MTSLAEQPGAGSGSLAAPAGSGADEVGPVLHRLRTTFDSGRTGPVEWRLDQLRALDRLLVEREEEIATALATDLGRDVHESWFGDIAPTRGEIAYARRHLRRWTRPTRVPVPLALMPGRASYRYEPLGVVLVIGPWNYPFYLCLGPLIGALAAGDCVVVKPSEHAPASSAAMAALVPKYLDRDAVAVVEGGGSVTQALIESRVDHVFFTGGSETGRKVMEAAARHLTPVTLELGGKSPVIVTRDADIDVAARRIAFGKLLNSGQTCLAPDYVLVEEEVKDRLVDALRDCLRDQRKGHPSEQPIVDDRQLQRLVRLLGDRPGRVAVGGEAAGAEAAGGEARNPSMQPTIVVDPAPDAALMRSEIFGPILPVLGVRSLGDAIAFVNDREKPLAVYVFSEKKADHERVFREVPAGGAVANHTLMHVLAPQLPFGGVGQSGTGAYHGRWGFENFSHRKGILVMRSRPDLKLIYPPYSERAKKLLRWLA